MSYDPPVDTFDDADGGSGRLGEVKDALTRKIGPLQVWHWIIIIVGGLLLAWYIRARSRGVGAQTTTTTDDTVTSAGLSPEPIVITQEPDSAQTEYYESILGLLEQIGQQGIDVNPPAEGWPITTPVPINVDVGGDVMEGIGTAMEGIVQAEAAQTRLARIAAIRAQITDLRQQIANLTAARAAATTAAQKAEITARIKAKRQRIKALQAQIKAIRGGGSTSAGSGTSTSGSSSGAAYPF